MRGRSAMKGWRNKKGERNEKLSIAMSLLKEGLEKQFISRITGLSLEKLDELIQK